MLIYILILFVNVVIGVVAQILLKKGMMKANIGKLGAEGFITLIKKMFFWNWNVWTGGILYGLSLINWIIVLTQVDLSFAYPAISSNYFFVALFSKFYFKEHVSWKRWASIFVIIAGICVLAMGSF